MGSIEVSIDDEIAYLSLQRYQEARNAFDAETKHEMTAEIDRCRDNEDVRVIVIQSESEDVFSAGGDLKEGGQNDHSVDAIQSLARDWEDLYFSMLSAGKPVIAEVKGDAIAGGLDLLLFADIVVASTDSEFRLPESRMGHVDWFNLSMLPHVVGLKHTLEFAMTGSPINAERAAEIGLINHAVPVEDVEAKVRSIAEALTETHPETVKRIKESVYTGINMSPAAAYLCMQPISFENLRQNPNHPEGFDDQLN
jgi:enoyl-CoA hydratase/carnithine racemase